MSQSPKTESHKHFVLYFKYRWQLPFICERGRCDSSVSNDCSCTFGGIAYQCGSTIGYLEHSCTTLTCDSNGNIQYNVARDPNTRLPASNCCSYRENLVLDGDYYSPSNAVTYLCCKGKLIR